MSDVSMELLRPKFNGMLISKLGDVAWPPRSSNLIVPYFYLLGGYLKRLVYKGSPINIKKLKRSIGREINNSQLMFLNMYFYTYLEEW